MPVIEIPVTSTVPCVCTLYASLLLGLIKFWNSGVMALKCFQVICDGRGIWVGFQLLGGHSQSLEVACPQPCSSPGAGLCTSPCWPSGGSCQPLSPACRGPSGWQHSPLVNQMLLTGMKPPQVDDKVFEKLPGEKLSIGDSKKSPFFEARNYWIWLPQEGMESRALTVSGFCAAGSALRRAAGLRSPLYGPLCPSV